MTARRWKLPVAAVAAIVVAEVAVWPLRPDERLEPLPVAESRYFEASELERARDYACRPAPAGPGRDRRSGRRARAARRCARRAAPWATVERVTRGRAWPAAALAGAGLVVVVIAAGLPFAAWAHERAVDVGRPTQSWGGWAEDRSKSTAIAMALARGGDRAAVRV